MWHECEVQSEYFEKRSKGVIRTWLDIIIELFTNSHASLTRTGRGGEITIELNIREEKYRNRKCVGFTVSDNAEGISPNRLKEIMKWGNTEGKGRGYFGSGLKETIYECGEGEILTVYKKILYRYPVKCDNNVHWNDSIEPETTDKENGTTITLTHRDGMFVPDFDTIAQQLTNHYSMIKANSDPTIKVKLVGKIKRTNGVIETLYKNLKYENPPIKQVALEKVVRMPEFNDKVHIRFYETMLPLTPASTANPYNLGGINICSENIVYDRQSFSTLDSAKYFWGEVECEKLRKLSDNKTIYPFNVDRAGLSAKDTYVKQLFAIIQSEVQPLIEKKSVETAATSVASFTDKDVKEINRAVNMAASEYLKGHGLKLERGSGGISGVGGSASDTGHTSNGGRPELLITEFAILPRRSMMQVKDSKNIKRLKVYFPCKGLPLGTAPILTSSSDKIVVTTVGIFTQAKDFEDIMEAPLEVQLLQDVVTKHREAREPVVEEATITAKLTLGDEVLTAESKILFQDEEGMLIKDWSWRDDKKPLKPFDLENGILYIYREYPGNEYLRNKNNKNYKHVMKNIILDATARKLSEFVLADNLIQASSAYNQIDDVRLHIYPPVSTRFESAKFKMA